MASDTPGRRDDRGAGSASARDSALHDSTLHGDALHDDDARNAGPARRTGRDGTPRDTTPRNGTSRTGTSRATGAQASAAPRHGGLGPDAADADLAIYRSRWRAAVRMVLQRVLFRALVRSQVSQTVIVADGVKRLTGAFVVVANHTSHLDAPLLAEGLPRRQARFVSTGVAYDYFFKDWYKRWFVRWMFNAFPIDRDGSRRNAGMSRRLLRYGVPIVVFPEGTRQMTGRIADFKPGAAALATGVGVPVVPAALIGGYEAMPKGRSWPKPGRPPVAVVFGEPLTADPDESVTEFTARIRDRVQELYTTHHDRILGPAPEPGTAGDGTKARKR